MSLQEFWDKVVSALKAGVHKTLVWFNLSVKPELLDFIEDNKELITEFILDAAKKYAGQPGHLKFESVKRMLIAYFGEHKPDMKISSSWLNFAIEFIYQILKASGKI